jgi:hypothetical protein
MQERAALDHTAVHIARRAENVRMAAVGVQSARQHARFFGRLQDHRARAVAEQHAGGAVLEIENAREGFRADHERRAMLAAANRLSAIATA